MKTLKFVGLILALIITSFSYGNTVHVKEAKWEKLGSRTVNMKADHDVIAVNFHEGYFSKIKLEIRYAPIHLKNINIVFGNGENKNVVFNKKIASGGFTRMIDLPGNKRIIKHIKLNYKSIRNGNGKATAVAYGKH